MTFVHLRRLALTAITAVIAMLTLAAPPASSAPQAAQATTIRGGDLLYSNSGTMCMVGFNARSASGVYYALLAGQCTDGTTTWYADPARTIVVGTTIGSSFPGNDYGVIRYTNTTVAYPGEVNLRNGTFRDITGAANPSVGQTICHVGRTTGLHCGTVTGLNATVNYGGGDIVYGLISSNVCAEAGDTGGPAFSGTTALGMIVGGTGNCSSGGTTYYQPIVEVLSAYGLSVY